MTARATDRPVEGDGRDVVLVGPKHLALVPLTWERPANPVEPEENRRKFCTASRSPPNLDLYTLQRSSVCQKKVVAFPLCARLSRLLHISLPNCLGWLCAVSLHSPRRSAERHGVCADGQMLLIKGLQNRWPLTERAHRGCAVIAEGGHAGGGGWHEQ